MPFTTRPGAELYWKREGRDDAPALILLNSIGTDMDLWAEVLPELRDQFSLLRIDMRGHGASRAAPGDVSMSMLASDVLAVADDAGINAFSIAGVSLGGMVAMELALQSPALVQKLALICTSAAMDPQVWSARVDLVRSQGMGPLVPMVMSRFLSELYSASAPGVTETIERQLLAMDPEAYAGCAAAIRDMELESRISAIRVPTLVVTGARDTSTPFAGHGQKLVDRIPEARHVEIDAAHLAPLEAPAALASDLAVFFRG